MRFASAMFLAVIALTVGQIHSNPVKVDSPLKHLLEKSEEIITEVKLNDFFDERLDYIQQLIYQNDMDPMEMPDMMIPVPNIPGLKSQIHLQKGWLQQLSTIQRTGDVILRYKQDKLLEFDFDLGWQEVNVNYAYTFRHLLGLRKGEFFAKFKNLHVSILGTMDMVTRQLNMRFFKIVNVGPFSLRLEGHLADHLINVITKLITVVAKERVIREIEHQIILAIEEKINDINDLTPEPINKIKFTF